MPSVGYLSNRAYTHKDVWKNYLKYQHELSDAISHLTSDRCTWEAKESELITNLAYSTAIARVIYYCVPGALPDTNDIAGLANYWKQHYNTHLGKGKVKEFIKHYEE